MLWKYTFLIFNSYFFIIKVTIFLKLSEHDRDSSLKALLRNLPGVREV
ncbi:hypothetical protein M595_6078 [Lyngbya aestuarii BL J]|uniref:Uncharacterized protein n=1 Tax=Lyngbya aestuarii BL J TaxID=1348334 RepID=U7QA68_9CYAN|nr:hypothetical protein M595_6395 [Lyngbya aestuarii BL J]ERT03673.1 hypothetical protein M595_6386 [Lyngbya aestuarii BL J]ERT03743.1 hypothetical protein M595_6316 [Lyngbya aestuarii BL J]ERT03980.1 hypothetical protein M595_6078 [Lyngbya aestuarii BL J]